MDKYTLDQLVDTFLEHSKDVEKRERFDDFNIAAALYVICKELKELKDKNG